MFRTTVAVFVLTLMGVLSDGAHPSPSLLVAVSSRIEAMDVDGKNVKVMADISAESEAAVRVRPGFEEEAVYVTVWGSNRIVRVDTSGSEVKQTLVPEGTAKTVDDFVATGRNELVVATRDALIRATMDWPVLASSEVVHEIGEQVTFGGVALDRCDNRLFWSEGSGQGARIQSLIEAEPVTITSSNMTNPKSLAFDSWTKTLYWIDLMEGNRAFSLERVRPDGVGREVVCEFEDQSPFDLAVGKEWIVWSDLHNMAVWRLSKSAAGCQPEVVRRLSERPMGVALLERAAPCDSPVVPVAALAHSSEEEETVIEPTPSLSSKNASTVHDICHNYCLHGGRCIIIQGQSKPYCQCVPAFSGDRCESNVCTNYCTDSKALCRVGGDGPTCLCPDGSAAEGRSCAIDGSGHPPTAIMVIFLLILLISICLVALLCLQSLKIRRLRESLNASRNMTPPTRADLVGDNNANNKKENMTPLIVGSESNNFGKSGCSASKCRGGDGGDACIVDLEDCCHMTLCDTPCVAATFRKATNRWNRSAGSGFNSRNLSPVSIMREADCDGLIENEEPSSDGDERPS